MKSRKKSSTSYPILFLMVDSTDHITGKTGLTPTVTISKNGGAFASPSGSVTELANGWYALAGNATDRDTLGEFVVHATGTGADPLDDKYYITEFDPFDAVRGGMTALPNAVAEASGGLYTRGSGAGQIAQDANGRISVNLVAILGTLLTETAGQIAAGFKKLFDVASPVFTLTSVNQSGDAYSLIGANGSGLTSLAPASTALSTSQWSNTRAGYLDNLSVGAVAQASELAKVPKSDGTVTWNSSAAAQIQGEANDALVANNLDHLVLSAVDTNFATTVHQDSVIGQLADNGGGFDRTTDSLEAISDSSSSPPSTAAIADAVWDEARAGHVTPGSFGEGVASVQGNVTGNVGGNVAGSVGSVTGSVGSVAADVTIANGHLTAAKFGSGAITSTVLANDAITSAKIADGAFTAAKFASGAFDAVWTVAARTLTSVSGLGIATASKLLKYFQLLLRKDAAIATDNAAELTEINANGGSGSGSVDNTTDSTQAIADNSSNPAILQTTTIATLTSQVSFTLTAGSADNKAYEGCVIIVTDASTSTQKAKGVVLQYVGSTKTVRLAFDPGVFTMAVGDTVAIMAAHETPVVHAELSVKSTAGNTAQLTAWMEVAGKKVPIATIDASASCSITVREHGSGVDLFTTAGVAADITNSMFEVEQANPGFTDDRQYELTATITLNGVAYSTTHSRVVIG